MNSKQKIFSIIGGLIFIIVVYLLVKKKAPAVTVKTGVAPAAGDTVAPDIPLVLPLGTLEKAPKMIAPNITHAVSSLKAFEARVLPAASTIGVPQGGDIAAGCLILVDSLPTTNTDLTRLQAQLNGLVKQGTPTSTLHTNIMFRADMVSAVLKSTGYLLKEGYDFNIHAGNTKVLAIPAHQYYKSANGGAIPIDIINTRPMIDLYQSLVNEYLPQIKTNLGRINSALDLTNFTNQITALIPKIQSLTTATPLTTFTQAANDLVSIDRWIRQMIVFEVVLTMDTNVQAAYKDNYHLTQWFWVRAQALEFIEITQNPLLAIGANGDNTPVAPYAFFEDFTAIKLLNSARPTVAPTMAEIANANANAAAFQQSQLMNDVTIVAKVAAIIVSILL